MNIKCNLRLKETSYTQSGGKVHLGNGWEAHWKEVLFGFTVFTEMQLGFSTIFLKAYFTDFTSEPSAELSQCVGSGGLPFLLQNLVSPIFQVFTHSHSFSSQPCCVLESTVWSKGRLLLPRAENQPTYSRGLRIRVQTCDSNFICQSKGQTGKPGMPFFCCSLIQEIFINSQIHAGKYSRSWGFIRE